MTTKVTLGCPPESHWHLGVTVQEQLFDPKSQKHVPGEYTKVEHFVLKQGEVRDVYIWDSRRLIIDEVVPEIPVAAGEAPAS